MELIYNSIIIKEKKSIIRIILSERKKKKINKMNKYIYLIK